MNQAAAAKMTLWWQPLLLTATNSLSVGSSVWLIKRLRSYGGMEDGRLIHLQLLQIAFSDIFLSIGSVFNCFIGESQFVDGLSLFSGDLLCRVSMSVLIGTKFVSIIFGTHLAVGFMCIYWRCTGLLYLLKQRLWMSWLVGIVLGLVIAVNGAYYNRNDSQMHCYIASVYQNIEGLFMMTCVSLSVLIYLFAAFRLCFYPGGVRHVGWRSTVLYPFFFLLTQALLLYHFITNEGGNLYYAAMVCESFNGFLNLVAYLLSSSWDDKQRAEREAVRRNISSSTIRSTSISRLELEERMGSGQFPVGFNIMEDSFHVEPLQREALARSESEIRSIEENKSWCDSGSSLASSGA